MGLRNSCKPLSSPAVFLAALSLAGGLVLPVANARTAPSDQPPNLGGTWKLNKDKSDNPRQKVQEAMGDSGGSGGTRGGHGGWAQRNGRPRGEITDFSQLTILQNGADIKVTGASGRTMAVLPADTNAPANADSNSTGEYAPPSPTVHWQNKQLIAETNRSSGSKTTRTYELSPDGTQLYVTTTIENPDFRQPVTYRLVFDRAKSD